MLITAVTSIQVTNTVETSEAFTLGTLGTDPRGKQACGLHITYCGG